MLFFLSLWPLRSIFWYYGPVQSRSYNKFTGGPFGPIRNTIKSTEAATWIEKRIKCLSRLYSRAGVAFVDPHVKNTNLRWIHYLFFFYYYYDLDHTTSKSKYDSLSRREKIRKHYWVNKKNCY